MVAYRQPAFSQGRPLITGELGVVRRVEDYVRSFHKNLSDAIQAGIDIARKELRAAARLDPAWAEFEDILDVEFVKGNFQYVLKGDPALVKAALNVEYGAVGSPPNALLRKQALVSGHRLGAMISKRLVVHA